MLLIKRTRKKLDFDSLFIGYPASTC